MAKRAVTRGRAHGYGYVRGRGRGRGYDENERPHQRLNGQNKRQTLDETASRPALSTDRDALPCPAAHGQVRA